MSHRYDKLALGVDGGGTKSDAVLINESGSVLGWGRSGTGQAFWAGRKAAQEAYAEAIRMALGKRRPHAVWVAGVHRSTFDGMNLHVSEPHFVECRELSMGLAMALQTHGLLVLSGTGAFVAGQKENGGTLTLDGIGPVLGDHGSGYQIGLMGMRAAMASSWAPERQTVLGQLVPQGLGVSTLEDMFSLVYTQGIGRSHIASVAKAVIRAAEDGDSIARKIIVQAADDISDVLAHVIRRLCLEDSDYALVASGGIAQNSEMYWGRICERALEIAPRLRPIRPKVRPCVGAALLALKAMGVAWTRKLLSRIEKTQQPHLAKLEKSEEAVPPLAQKSSRAINLEYTAHGPWLRGDIPED